MAHYIKCPRCELNYIDAEKQEYCDVCIKEVKGIPTDADEIEEAEEDLPTEICPICGENMMRPGDKMCEECRKKAEYEEESDPEDDDDEWRNYLDDDTDAELDSEIGDIGEDFDAEFGGEEEEEPDEEYQGEEEEEDLEYVTGDDIYRLSGDDDDDDDESDKDDDF